MFTFSRLGDVAYWGRLGNQLWEIASTVGIARRNHQDYVFPEWKYNNYFRTGIPTSNNVYNFPLYRYEGFEYKEIDLEGDVDLLGYFQSYKYFDHCKDEILRLFRPRMSVNFPLTQTAIHIRRGDYLDRSSFHTVLSMEYYKKAMTYFPNSEFTIFSDDIQWCKKNFDIERCYFVEPSEDILDFFYMASFENQIISNSSYSYWAAYLNTNYNKKIIAPKDWCSFPINNWELCPPEWTRI